MLECNTPTLPYSHTIPCLVLEGEIVLEAERTEQKKHTSGAYARIGCALLIGFVAGILSGGLGIGGGIIMVPAMVYLLSMTQHKAHGTSLAAIWAIVLLSAGYYSINKQVDWVVAAEIAVGGIIGASIGARICTRISGGVLRKYFALFLWVSALKMLWDAYNAHRQQVEHAVQMASHIAATEPLGALIIFTVGIAAGILSGLLGVGGGIIMVPALVILGFSQKLAQGVSLAVIIPISVSGAFTHYKRGNVVPEVALWLGIGGIGGGLLGSALAGKAPDWILKIAFGVLMLIVGWLMFRQKPSEKK